MRLPWHLLKGEKTRGQVLKIPTPEVHTISGQPLRGSLPDGNETEQKNQVHIKKRKKKALSLVEHAPLITSSSWVLEEPNLSSEEADVMPGHQDTRLKEQWGPLYHSHP